MEARLPHLPQYTARRPSQVPVTCQQNKNFTHWPNLPLYWIPPLQTTHPFKQVAMDLITDLPLSQGFDSILTIVDHRCSRAALFIPCLKTITGEGVAKLYLDHIFPWFRTPTKIISDQDPWFTSLFGQALCKRLGIQQNLSIAFHP